MIGGIGLPITNVPVYFGIAAGRYQLHEFQPIRKREIGNQIVYPGYIESGEKLDESYDALSDENKLASYSFNNDEEIIVHELKNDYKKKNGHLILQ